MCTLHIFYVQVPEFPVFTRSGEVTVRLELSVKNVKYTQAEVERFERFHHFLFSRVLRLDKEPMQFEPKEAPGCCLVLPVQTGV